MLAFLADRADRECVGESGVEARFVVTSERYDSGDAGFEGRDRSPLFNQRLAAVLRVTSLIGCPQPVAGDLAALSAQFALEGIVALRALPRSAAIAAAAAGVTRTAKPSPVIATVSCQRSISSPRLNCSMPSRAQSWPSRSRSCR